MLGNILLSVIAALSLFGLLSHAVTERQFRGDWLFPVDWLIVLGLSIALLVLQ